VIVTPSSQSIEVTHTAMFTANVSGVEKENFMYQWRHNGTIITGKTRDTLMIPKVMESDSGDYECIVTNQYGDYKLSDVVVLIITSELSDYIVLYILTFVTIRSATFFYYSPNGHNSYFRK